MRCKSYSEAADQAQANANRSKEMWYVFVDQNGVYNAEPLGEKEPFLLRVFRPQKEQTA